MHSFCVDHRACFLEEIYKMFEPKNEESQWMQCLGCDRWRLLPPGISSDDLRGQWFCHMEPFNGNCDMPEVAEILDNSVTSVSKKSAAACTGLICDSKSSWEKLIPKRKRTADPLRKLREFRVPFVEIPHEVPLDNQGRRFFPKKTKFLQTSIKSFLSKKPVLIQKSIKDYFPKKTKLLQKTIKDFFPTIRYHKAMKTLRRSRVNGMNRDVTEGHSRTIIINITVPRKFR